MMHRSEGVIKENFSTSPRAVIAFFWQREKASAAPPLLCVHMTVRFTWNMC